MPDESAAHEATQENADCYILIVTRVTHADPYFINSDAHCIPKIVKIVFLYITIFIVFEVIFT